MKKKSLLAMLLAFCMIVSLAPTALAANGEISGTGTASDPYLIKDAADLSAFRDAVNNGKNYEGKTIALANSITLTGEWTPIGNGTRSGNSYTGNAFKGTFDGRNYTISGLTITAAPDSVDDALGLFGVVDGGTVKNLVLTGVNINVPTSELAGGAIGILTNNGLANSITVSGSVSATRGNGGIVGRMLISGTISNCVNNAKISATGANVGGIVGAAYYTAVGKTMTISGCTNNGVITSTSSGVGGIAGLSSANISGCTNTASITGGGFSVGGIVGEQQNYGSIIGCTNSAAVSVNAAASNYGTGGIIGWIRYSGSAENYPLKGVIVVKDNVNSGNVTGASDAGGIVGTVYHAAEVTGNTNTAATLTAANFAAGIVANFQFSDTYWGDPIPEKTLNANSNISTTALDKISATCKNLYVYDNSSGTQDGKIENNGSAWVAQIGTVKYTTLKDAIAKAEPGNTVKLLASYNDWKAIQIGKNITLDLNGYDINRTFGGVALDITDGIVTVIGGGKISGATNGVMVAYDAELIVRNVSVEGRDGHGIDNDGKLTVDGAAINATQYGIALYSNAEKNWAASLNMLNGSVSGTFGVAAYENTTVTVKGGTISGTSAGLSGEGSSHGTTFIIEGGTIKSESGVGIYHPQNGTLTIKGGKIIGATAINMKSGTLKVLGGTIHGTGARTDYNFVGGSFTPTGDALVIESCGYPGGAPTAEISGGTFISDYASAVASYTAP